MAEDGLISGHLTSSAEPATTSADTLLLHTCCGPCSTVTVPAWRAEGLHPAAFFYNPNIGPRAEFERRLAAMRTLAATLELPLAEGPTPEVEPLAPAGPAPARCRLCIGRRLDETARRAGELGIPRFATTLALSPYQPHDVIRQCGEEAAARHGVDYLYVDHRHLFASHHDECRRLGLYRQRYCGCVASKWEAWHDRRARTLRRAG